ncbi:hypothetical protein EDC01DRAFT_620767 [Geopyxis carbonaria]|nr:hypothetical protein EDC01DRAFT_620767 [Geopyxis carbonaria]
MSSDRESPSKRRLPRSPSILILFLLAIGIFATQASAVLISKFDNCLSDFTKKSPTHLQFHPILVAAEFDPIGSDENYLRMTVWGTVTGKDESTPALQSKRDLHGHDMGSFGGLEHEDGYNYADGQIGDVYGLGEGVRTKRELNGPVSNSSQIPRPSDKINYTYSASIPDNSTHWQEAGANIVATTVSSRITIASFEIKKNDTFFCGKYNHPDSIGANCPFGDLIGKQRSDIDLLTSELPSFSTTWRLPADYQFATIGVKIRIIAGDREQTDIGCIHVEATPIFTKANGLALTWVPASILVMVGLACALAAMYNPWNGTTDVFKWSSNFGMDEDMIRLVTPGFGDCLQWIQFIVLTGSLSLNYPGFYQAAVSKGAWSVLLLNKSLYSSESKPATDMWRADGLYAVQSWVHGYEQLAQLVGLQTTNDIWVSVAAWYAVLTFGAVAVFQMWFWGRTAVRKAVGIEEEDLTSRNWPFTIGLMCRFTYNYFLLPLLTASFFQLTVLSKSATVISVLAGLVILVVLGVAFYLTHVIWRYRPRAALFDELPLLLKYGTFYNTYREKNLKFFIVHLYTNILRAIAFGALQANGIAQIAILAVCEIVTLLTLWGIKPFASETSMNLWNIIFSAIRLITVLLMMAFVSAVGAPDGVRSWIGWVTLGTHAVVLVFGFVFKALQTYLELALRGYKNEDDQASRGGFAKVFGVRQLSRRKRHSKQTHRSSSLTPTPISASERKPTLTTMSSRHPHSRSNSSAILLASPSTGHHPEMMMQGHDGSQSGHVHSNSGSTAAGFTPTTPGTGGYGYMPPLAVDTGSGPYYRPPRTRRMTDSDQYSPGERSRGSWGSGMWEGKNIRSSQGSLPTSALANQVDRPDDPEWEEAHLSTGDRGTPTAQGHRYTDSAVTVGSNRGDTDYAVREMDFYYGFRGPALSSQPARRLGTGPADPTGPASTAKSWIKQKLGLAKSKEEKGFSVVRSSRAPDQLRVAQREAELQQRAAGGVVGGGEDDVGEIGVAITSPEMVERHPGREDTDSDDTDSGEEAGPSSRMLEKRPEGDPEIELSRRPSKKPTLPRKSSKRKSRDTTTMPDIQPHLYDPPLNRGSTPRLPFEESSDVDGRRHSRSFSTTSSHMLELPAPITDMGRPASVGEVHRGRVGSVIVNDREDVRGSQAELVRGGSGSSRNTQP